MAMKRNKWRASSTVNLHILLDTFEILELIEHVFAHQNYIVSLEIAQSVSFFALNSLGRVKRLKYDIKISNEQRHTRKCGFICPTAMRCIMYNCKNTDLKNEFDKMSDGSISYKDMYLDDSESDVMKRRVVRIQNSGPPKIFF